MKRILIGVGLVLLVACGRSATAGSTTESRLSVERVGKVDDTITIFKVSVDGQPCIVTEGYHSDGAITCNWNNR